MHRRRYAKIVATLGPASSSSEMIRALFEAAADVFRFNFSHGTHDEHQARYDIVRAIEAETGRPIAVLADLQGPKLRNPKIPFPAAGFSTARSRSAAGNFWGLGGQKRRFEPGP